MPGYDSSIVPKRMMMLRVGVEWDQFAFIQLSEPYQSPFIGFGLNPT